MTVEVPNFAVPRCSNCGELVFDYRADEQIRAALGSQFGPTETATAGASMSNHSLGAEADMSKKEKCRRKLIETAAAGTLITFDELAPHLGMIARGPWNTMLDEIYEEETDAGRPDLTLLVVYKNKNPNKRYPPYISRGGPVRSVKFDPKNPEHLKKWNAERMRLYQIWSPAPKT